MLETKAIFRRLTGDNIAKERVKARELGLSYPEAGVPDVQAILEAFGIDKGIIYGQSVDSENRSASIIKQNKKKRLKLPIKFYDYPGSDVSIDGSHNEHADRES